MSNLYRTFKPRLAKGIAVKPLDNNGKYKGRCSYLLEACGARYSGRDNAYILPESKLPIFIKFVDNGWKAGIFGGFYHNDDTTKIAYRQAKKEVNG